MCQMPFRMTRTLIRRFEVPRCLIHLEVGHHAVFLVLVCGALLRIYSLRQLLAGAAELIAAGLYRCVQA